MTKVAILGANGFIGLRLVESLLLRGVAEVCAVVKAPSSYAALSRFALEGRVADVRDADALRAAFRGCDVVAHTAAGDRSVVVDGIEPVYRAASDAGVRRLVYLSSLVVHGYNPAPDTNEESPLSRKHEIDYCNWKVAAEARLRQLRRRGGPEIVVLRPGIVLGPRAHWVRDFATALSHGRAYVIGEGTGVCPSIYIDNLVQAIELASFQAGVDGESFIVGDAERVSWKDVYAPIVQAMGRSWSQDLHHLPGVPQPPFALRLLQDLRRASLAQSIRRRLPSSLRSAVFAGIDRLSEGPGNLSPFDAKPSRTLEVTREMTLLQHCNCKLSHDKAERMLGYRPKVSFEDGMAATLGWLEFAGYLPMDGASWPERARGR